VPGKPCCQYCNQAFWYQYYFSGRNEKGTIYRENSVNEE
jgi:hypothetical protein